MSAPRPHLIIPHDFEANYVMGFVRGLAAHGLHFAVVSSEETGARLAEAGIRQTNLRGRLTTNRPVWLKALNLARYYLLLFWTIFLHRGLLNDRIILFDGLLLPVWMRLWARCYIHTAHNVLPHGRANQRLFRIMYRWIYRFPHHIVAHTPRIADELTRGFGVAPARISVISIGLNEEVPVTALTREAARRQLGVPESTPLLVFFGKVDAYKGVDVLAAAWEKVKTAGARLIVVGWCPDRGYAEQVRAAMTRSTRAASMEWREEFVPNEQIEVWLKACDAVVMPYRNIYQSGVVFLCLRFGVPIVATRVGSLAEYIDESTGVLADDNTPEGIAAAIDVFFSHRNRFNRENIAGKAARYGWAGQCAAIKHLYP